MSPDLCHKINSRFDLLDVDGDHVLTISELKLSVKRPSMSRRKNISGLVKQLNPLNEIFPLVAGSIGDNHPMHEISNADFEIDRMPVPPDSSRQRGLNV
jgi:hypothetical protein